MPNELIQKLEGILTSATESLPQVSGKKMFGCHALWANGNVFALVWKHGRIGVKLPDEKAFAELMKISGSEPWKAGPMTMKNWVLVPSSFHSARRKDLQTWLKRGHAFALSFSADTAKKPTKKKA